MGKEIQSADCRTDGSATIAASLRSSPCDFRVQSLDGAFSYCPLRAGLRGKSGGVSQTDFAAPYMGFVQVLICAAESAGSVHELLRSRPGHTSGRDSTAWVEVFRSAHAVATGTFASTATGSNTPSLSLPNAICRMDAANFWFICCSVRRTRDDGRAKPHSLLRSGTMSTVLPFLHFGGFWSSMLLK